jgi:hypothetical protein
MTPGLVQDSEEISDEDYDLSRNTGSKNLGSRNKTGIS